MGTVRMADAVIQSDKQVSGGADSLREFLRYIPSGETIP